MHHRFRISALVLGITLLASCDAAPSSPAGESPASGAATRLPVEPTIAETRAEEIWSSSEVQLVLSLQDTFVARVYAALQAGVPLDTLRAAAHLAASGNDAQLAVLLFGSTQAGAAFATALADARAAAITAFPEVTYARNDTDPSECTLRSGTVDSFFDNFTIIHSSRLTPLEDAAAQRDRGPVCGSYWKQLKLLGCMGLCSATTAGLGAAFCGWGCWCTLCTTNSALADLMC
jgi:hypothetical protein